MEDANETIHDIIDAKNNLLEIKIQNLVDGQLEIVEDVMAVEETVKTNASIIDTHQLELSQLAYKTDEIDKDIDYFLEQHAREIATLEYKVNGHEGGHNHPKFFKWLGWIK